MAKRHLVTASRSALLKSGCTRWVHPDAQWFEDRPEDARKREDGKEFHWAMHMQANGVPCHVSARLESKVKLATAYLERVLLPSVETLQTEVVLGLNLSTGEAYSSREIADRDYPELPDWLYGTADIVGTLSNGGILIADWKTGSSEGAEDQLKTLACMAVSVPDLWNGGPIVLKSLSVTDHTVNPVTYSPTMRELTEHRDHIIGSLRWEGQSPSNPVAGPHCVTLYCPHMAYCPSTRIYAARFAQDIYREQSDLELSTEEAGRSAVRLKALQRATKHFEGKLKDWLRSGNRAVADGWEYKETDQGFRLVKVKENAS